MKTLQQLAQEAIDVQNACNLCGVAQGFAAAMIELGKHTNGTNERNTHPIAQLWAYKISALSGQEYLESPVYESAYNRCVVMSSGEKLELDRSSPNDAWGEGSGDYSGSGAP